MSYQTLPFYFLFFITLPVLPWYSDLIYTVHALFLLILVPSPYWTTKLSGVVYYQLTSLILPPQTLPLDHTVITLFSSNPTTKTQYLRCSRFLPLYWYDLFLITLPYVQLSPLLIVCCWVATLPHNPSNM